MTYLKAQIKWKRSHVLTTCNAIKMPVRIAACKLPQNRANMALTFFSPFITTQNKFFTPYHITNFYEVWCLLYLLFDYSVLSDTTSTSQIRYGYFTYLLHFSLGF